MKAPREKRCPVCKGKRTCWRVPVFHRFYRVSELMSCQLPKIGELRPCTTPGCGEKQRLTEEAGLNPGENGDFWKCKKCGARELERLPVFAPGKGDHA